MRLLDEVARFDQRHLKRSSSQVECVARHGIFAPFLICAQCSKGNACTKAIHHICSFHYLCEGFQGQCVRKNDTPLNQGETRASPFYALIKYVEAKRQNLLGALALRVPRSCWYHVLD
jgi:hypothetical protein